VLLGPAVARQYRTVVNDSEIDFFRRHRTVIAAACTTLERSAGEWVNGRSEGTLLLLRKRTKIAIAAAECPTDCEARDAEFLSDGDNQCCNKGDGPHLYCRTLPAPSGRSS
jgi:hypothetical protein